MVSGKSLNLATNISDFEGSGRRKRRSLSRMKELDVVLCSPRAMVLCDSRSTNSTHDERHWVEGGVMAVTLLTEGLQL